MTPLASDQKKAAEEELALNQAKAARSDPGSLSSSLSYAGVSLRF
jgi:hypothetical protein